MPNTAFVCLQPAVSSSGMVVTLSQPMAPPAPPTADAMRQAPPAGSPKDLPDMSPVTLKRPMEAVVENSEAKKAKVEGSEDENVSN